MSAHCRTAVITGAAGGIGSAITRRLADAGFALHLVGRTAQRLERLAASLQATSAPVRTFAFDLTNDANLTGCADQIAKDEARLDVLAFCHGNYARARLEDSAIGDLDRLYAANVRAPLLLTKSLLPLLRAGRGQVVFINSTLGLKGSEYAGQYAATQHALKGMADTLRNEVNPSGVRVLSVFCGRTATPMQRRLHAMEGRRYVPEMLSQPEDIALAVSAALMLGPNSEITDIRIRPMRPLEAPAVELPRVEEEVLADHPIN